VLKTCRHSSARFCETVRTRKLFVTQDDLALRITGLRLGETPFLQPLGADLDEIQINATTQPIPGENYVRSNLIQEACLVSS